MTDGGAPPLAFMSTLHEVEVWIAENLPSLIEKYDVPGAAVAVLSGGEIVDLAAGVLSRSTEVEATADSVFQIGDDRRPRRTLRASC
jgi:CubicO group peptidase (beta-lactamase class C family)